MIKKLRFTYSPDYSANSFFPFYNMEKIYNSILIPSNTIDQFAYLDIGGQIHICYDNIKTSYTVGYFCDKINIRQKEYLLFYIGRGVNIDNIFSNECFIEYRKNRHNLDLTFNLRKSTPKLFMGLLVLSDNYDFAFKDNDDLILRIDNTQFIDLFADKVKTPYNVYSPLQSNTVVFLDINKSLAGLTQLHTPIPINNLALRSLSTKRNKKRGQICLWLPGCYNLHIKSDNGYKKNSHFNRSAIFDNLDYGNYEINFFDKNDQLVYFNNNGKILSSLIVNIVDYNENQSTISIDNMQGQSQLLPRL